MDTLSPPKPNRSGPMTQQHIAQQLGVSRQLVGFALRGEGRMSDEVRRQILEVAKENGYDEYSNQAARTMASRRNGKRAKTGIVAVIFPATFEGQPLSSVPFFMPYFEGVESEVIQRGLDVMLCPSRPEGLPRLVLQGQVDGVIFMVTDISPDVDLEKLGLPFVHIMIACGPRKESDVFPALGIDTAHGYELATRHLIELGHERIGFFRYAGPPQSPESLQHDPGLVGYRAALQKHGLEYDGALVDLDISSTTIAAGSKAMERMLERGQGRPPFTSLVCHNDLVAMGAIRVLESAGLRVPDDVSVVGFDDVSPQYAFVPEITSIRFPRHQIGRRSVELICERLGDESEEDVPQEREIFPLELVQRASTRPINK